MNSSVIAPSYLIICFRCIGDVLVTTPLAISIKTAQPDAVIDYLVFKGTEKVLAKNPYIRNVFTISTDKSGMGTLILLFKKYDFAIAATPSDRAALSAAMAGKQTIGLTYGLRKEWWKSLVLDVQQVCYDRMHVVSNILMLLWRLGIEPVPRVVMGYDENDIAYARSAAPFNRYVIFHPYSSKEYKYWSAEKWAKLSILIQEQTDCIPVFTRTPEPEGDEYIEQIRKFSPNGITVIDSACSLNQLAAIIKGAVAFVGIDTIVTHMAAALETPTVAILGPTLTRYWAPWPNDSLNPSPFAKNKGIQHNKYITVLQRSWQCVPCNKDNCSISSRKVTECLEDISAKEVFIELEKFMAIKVIAKL
ncbi:MAG: glycosyltransferase family 9 protein [Methylococcaceae bacterium]|nr:glycosyltransferase family 9 protein [Methylococcaceae bacterium]